MVFHPDDLLMDTPELMKRIRPKQRYDQAALGVAGFLAISIIWAAALLQPPDPYPYIFIQLGESIVTADQRNGEVAICSFQPGSTICSENDSALKAFIRNLDSEDAEPR